MCKTIEKLEIMMWKSFFQNAADPGSHLLGQLFLRGMNLMHRPGARWALGFFPLEGVRTLLDVGCGGGRTIRTLLRRAPEAKLYGLDRSEASVGVARKINRRAIAAGRAAVSQGDVRQLPYADSFFDAVTAFETVYFWQPLDGCLREVCRVLRPGGRFLILCEVSDPVKARRWTDLIDGMIAYTPAELEQKLRFAGFRSVEIYRQGERMCHVATK